MIKSVTSQKKCLTLSQRGRSTVTTNGIASCGQIENYWAMDQYFSEVVERLLLLSQQRKGPLWS
jgi:hypothetical protein